MSYLHHMVTLLRENFLKILFGLFIFGLLGGTSGLLLQFIFIGIPMVVAGWAYIIFMMTVFKDSGWVIPFAGLTCMGPAFLVGKICNEIVQNFIK